MKYNFIRYDSLKYCYLVANPPRKTSINEWQTLKFINNALDYRIQELRRHALKIMQILIPGRYMVYIQYMYIYHTVFMQFSYIKVFYIGDKVRTFLHVVKSLFSLSRDSDPPNYKKCFLAQFLENVSLISEIY